MDKKVLKMFQIPRKISLAVYRLHTSLWEIVFDFNTNKYIKINKYLT